MTQFNINLDESIFYEKLFSQCDLQKSGKVTGLEAYKLFLKSGLPIEDLKKICEYCGANRLGFFGRSQFCIALKIISLAQAGISVDENILQNNANHSLPRFDHEVSPEAFKTVQTSSDMPLSIPPPPTKNHMRTLSGNNILHSVPLTNRYSYSSPISKSMVQNISKGSWDQFSGANPNNYNNLNINDRDFDRDDDEDGDNIWNGYSEEDNKGLLNSNIKTDFDIFCHNDKDRFDIEYSSSSDHDSSSFSFESDDNDQNVDTDYKDNNPTGYTLMEAVEGLAIAPATDNFLNVIPMATHEQLDYYTKCFQTMPEGDNGKVCSSDVIDFFQIHNIDQDCLDKILLLTNIGEDCQISLIEFSRALHLITHCKSGFAVPDTLPERLLPVEFEQPDEPFSFDLSDGEIPDVSNNHHLSSLDSSFSADGDSSTFDFPDVGMNRGWTHSKIQFLSNSQKSCSLKSFNKPPINQESKPATFNSNQKDDIIPVGRPRPYAKKSLSLPQSIPNTVAPPPPPRSNIPTESNIKKLSIDKGSDSSVDSNSVILSDNIIKEIDNVPRKLSESSKSDLASTTRHSSNQETRKQFQTSMRELKSKNHVLLRLNNEMTSELEEMREQRVNLSLQLEYIKQSQIDIQ